MFKTSTTHLYADALTFTPIELECERYVHIYVPRFWLMLRLFHFVSKSQAFPKMFLDEGLTTMFIYKRMIIIHSKWTEI